MALAATMHRFVVNLSDVDRGVYTELDLRVARHPSESVPYLLTRVLGYALCFVDGIAFTKGLCAGDEPALEVHDPLGQRTLWVEVGSPSAEKLHKATKSGAKVVVVTHHEPRSLLRNVRGRTIHKVETIEGIALSAALLDGLSLTLDRTCEWTVVVTGGEVFVDTGRGQFSGRVEKFSFAEA
jgi:uncharacterized protein YaeQ